MLRFPSAALGATRDAEERRLCSGAAALFITLGLVAALPGCGSAGSSSSPPPLPPPRTVSVSVAPASAAILLGQTQVFTASVTGTDTTGVTWSVNGVAGGNATTGTISSSGVYAAPQTLPSPSNFTVTATSQADPSASGSATVDIRSDIVVNVSPSSASLSTGGSQALTASVTSSGNPNPAVAWSVNGMAGGNSTLGTIASAGPNSATYTAPSAPPSPSTVSVTATSVADPSRSASASVTILCGATNSVSPTSASVALGQSQLFTATLCLPPGTQIIWDVNGTAGGDSVLGTVANNGGNITTYTAPQGVPSENPVVVRATSRSTPAQSAAASVTIFSNISVILSPNSASVTVSQRAAFAATVTNSPNQAVSWSVNGVTGGNAAEGRICLPSSSPCAAPVGPVSGSVEYLAPALVPSPNSVTLTAASQADPSRSGSAQVTIAAPQPVGVVISPPYAFLGPSGQLKSTQQFTARVVGTSNQGVTWSVASAVPGEGCSGSACGSVNSNGFYTSPAVAPSPNAISVTATSHADPTKSASATVAVTSGPVIEAIFPSSVMAGVASSFTLALEGQSFAAGSGSAASAILVNASPRATTCPSTTRCTTPLQPADTGAPGPLSIQVQNPGSPPPLSNPVSVLVVPFVVAEDVVSLSLSQPIAAGKDIVVVEPTTAASLSQINVDFAGPLSGSGLSATCAVQGSPIPVTRPVSGSAVASICVHGNNLDPSYRYEFTGPGSGDISVVASSLAGLFPDLIRLDLTISNNTLSGVRTLIITTPNNDKAAASGLIEVK